MLLNIFHYNNSHIPVSKGTLWLGKLCPAGDLAIALTEKADPQGRLIRVQEFPELLQCQSPASPLAVTMYVASSLLDCQCTLTAERASFEIFLISGLQGAEIFHINSI